MDPQLVSVIITTCKRGPQILERAIQSVISQTYNEWELIVVDDSPGTYEYRDKAKSIVLKYAEEFPILYHENTENLGACASRNIGLALAKGKYIAFLDDDDEWLPLKLELQVDALEHAETTVALVYCNNYRKTEGEESLQLIERPQRTGKVYEYLMKEGNFIGGMSIPLMKADAINNVGSFDPLMQSGQDIDLWLRLSKRYEFISIEVYLVINYWYPGDRISNNVEKKIEGRKRLIEKNLDYLDSHKCIKWKRLISLEQAYVIGYKKKEAFEVWKQAVKLCPYKIVKNSYELVRIIFTKSSK